MRAPITLPLLGRNPVRLSLWLAKAGERVFEGDRVVEVLTGPATFDVAAPATGKLAEIHAFEDDLLQPGQILGFIDVEGPED